MTGGYEVGLVLGGGGGGGEADSDFGISPDTFGFTNAKGKLRQTNGRLNETPCFMYIHANLNVETPIGSLKSSSPWRFLEPIEGAP